MTPSSRFFFLHKKKKRKGEKEERREGGTKRMRKIEKGRGERTRFILSTDITEATNVA